MFLKLEHVTKIYGDGPSALRALNDVGVDIEEKEMCVILGPSGAGKSTFLNAIGGLERVDKGSIKVGGTEITKLNRKNCPSTGAKRLDLYSSFTIL